MANSKENYLNSNKDLIIKWLNENTPLAEIARDLEVKYDTLKRFLIKHNIPYNTNRYRTGKPHLEWRKPAEYYMNNNKPIQAPVLRRKLIEEGLKEWRCECCGNTEWMGKQIPLELHHINGNHYDNHFENLQLLCCNCHGQKHEYSKTIVIKKISDIIKKNSEEQTKKNKDKSKIHKPHKECGTCAKCGKPLYRSDAKYCSYACARSASERIKYSKELLTETLEKYGTYSKSGKFLGISDRTFKKWCIRYGINKKDGKNTK